MSSVIALFCDFMLIYDFEQEKNALHIDEAVNQVLDLI